MTRRIGRLLTYSVELVGGGLELWRIEARVGLLEGSQVGARLLRLDADLFEDVGVLARLGGVDVLGAELADGLERLVGRICRTPEGARQLIRPLAERVSGQRLRRERLVELLAEGLGGSLPGLDVIEKGL